MKKVQGLTLLAAILFAVVTPDISAKADQKVTPLQTVLSNTTISGYDDVVIVNNSSVEYASVNNDPSPFESVSISPAPEPATVGLGIVGALALIGAKRRKS